MRHRVHSYYSSFFLSGRCRCFHGVLAVPIRSAIYRHRVPSESICAGNTALLLVKRAVRHSAPSIQAPDYVPTYAPYTGPSAQMLHATIRSLIEDHSSSKTAISSQTPALGRRVKDVILSLEQFFGIRRPVVQRLERLGPSPQLRSKPRDNHLVGDITTLVTASSSLLQLVHLGTDAESIKIRDIGRVVHVLKVATKLATDVKGLKFSASQIAEYISNFRYLDVCRYPEAEELLVTLSEKFNSRPTSPRDKIPNGSDRIRFSPQSLGELMLGVAALKSSDQQARDLIGVITDFIWRMNSDIDARCFSKTLYGLKRMSVDYPETRYLLRALVHILGKKPESSAVSAESGSGVPDKLSEPQRVMTVDEFSCALYGFQKLNDTDEAVRDLLQILTGRLQSMREANMHTPENLFFPGKSVAMCLYGLQGMSSNCVVVRDLVKELSSLFDIGQIVRDIQNGNVEIAERFSLSGASLASAIYGLKNMSSCHYEVRRLVDVLASRIEIARSDHPQSIESISAAYFGLRNMENNAPEISKLLQLLYQRLIRTSLKKSSPNEEGVNEAVRIDGRAVGNILYGLRFMVPDLSVRNTVRVLADSLHLHSHSTGNTNHNHYTFALNNREIAYAFHGMQNMSSRAPEVIALIRFLNAQLESHLHHRRPPLQPWEVTLMMCGLKNKDFSRYNLHMDELFHNMISLISEMFTRTSNNENFNLSQVCSILSCLQSLSLDQGATAKILGTTITSLRRCLSDSLVQRSHSEFSVGAHPSHQLISEAIGGMRYLSLNRSTCEILEGIESFLTSNQSIYSSPAASTRPITHRMRYVDQLIDRYVFVVQNRFTTDQVLNMFSGLQNMLTPGPEEADRHFLHSHDESHDVVEKFLEYLIDQLFLAHNADAKDLLGSASIKFSKAVYADLSVMIKDERNSNKLEECLQMVPSHSEAENEDQSSRSLLKEEFDKGDDDGAAIQVNVQYRRDPSQQWKPQNRDQMYVKNHRKPLDEMRHGYGGKPASFSEATPFDLYERLVYAPRALRLSPRQLGQLVLSIRGMDCSRGNAQQKKLNMLLYVSEELKRSISSCPTPEAVWREMTRASVGDSDARVTTIYRDTTQLFQRCLLSIPYIINLPSDIKTLMFRHLADMNKKLIDVEAHIREKKDSDSNDCSDGGWVGMLRKDIYKKLEAAAPTSSLELVGYKISTNTNLYQFDAAMVITVTMKRLLEVPRSFTDETGVPDMIVTHMINVEMASLSDHLDSDKKRFDQLRDQYLSNYHNVIIIRGDMYDDDNYSPTLTSAEGSNYNTTSYSRLSGKLFEVIDGILIAATNN